MISDYIAIKRDEFYKIFFVTLIAVFIIIFEGVILTAGAIECGSTIGPGETVNLRGDVGPCDSTRALTVDGPARLNLNGFTVSCNGKTDGIRINGEGAIVHNGTVANCNIAVDVRGEGHHQIVNLTVVGHVEENGDRKSNGIRVRSGKNDLIKNTALNNDRGIRVDEGSDNNKVINNFANLNNKGFRIDGDNNNIVGNEGNNNDSENFQIKGNNNRLVNNTANGGDEECFLIDLLNDETGEGGDRNQLINNYATGCSDGIVFPAGAQGNSITNNTALDNDFDLVDENCDNNKNVWKNNKFETKDGSCIE
jgi:parallel beta-helix repeat protein